MNTEQPVSTHERVQFRVSKRLSHNYIHHLLIPRLLPVRLASRLESSLGLLAVKDLHCSVSQKFLTDTIRTQ